MLRCTPVLWICALLAGSASAQAPADPFAAARAEFQAAWSAVAKTPREAAPPDSEALRRYPLYPYLQSARLQRELERLPKPAAGSDPTGPLPVDEAVASLLASLAEQPAARSLRRDWLASLAGRRAWPTFLGAYRAERDGGDAGLRCAGFTARIALGQDADLGPAVVETWLTGRSVPEACDAPFEWLRARGTLGDELVEQRARLALAAGDAALARYLARSLPAGRAAPLLQWAALIESPGTAVAALVADRERPVEPPALLDGWQRYARGSPDAAADLFPALVEARRLDARAASPYALAVALPLSWSRLPRALEFFSLARAEDFDERAHEWHARAALWVGEWSRVQRAIAAMPESLRNQNRWRYWAARAAEARGDDTAAHEGYAAVVGTDNWYAALSAARLRRPFAPTLERLPLDDAQIAALAAEPGFVRARELLRCELDAEATAEWRAAVDRLTPAQQVQAVGLASRWGWHLQAIADAAKLRLFNDYELLYPRPYDADVRAAAQRVDLPPELIYAIIRQESLYRADAASRAGALGLMQLLPATAARAARKFDLPVPTRASLLLPAVNIPVGSAELRSLIDRAAGQVPLATAGYNAGPAAARRWLPASPMATDVWVENIPFNETRAYVQRVAWHALVFAWLVDRKPRDVSGWLGTIQSPDAGVATTPTP